VPGKSIAHNQAEEAGISGWSPAGRATGSTFANQTLELGPRSLSAAKQAEPMEHATRGQERGVQIRRRQAGWAELEEQRRREGAPSASADLRASGSSLNASHTDASYTGASYAGGSHAGGSHTTLGLPQNSTGWSAQHGHSYALAQSHALAQPLALTQSQAQAQTQSQTQSQAQAQAQTQAQTQALTQTQTQAQAQAQSNSMALGYAQAQRHKQEAKKLNAQLCKDFSVGSQNENGGVFTSPAFPNLYPTNLVCTKVIEGECLAELQEKTAPDTVWPKVCPKLSPQRFAQWRPPNGPLAVSTSGVVFHPPARLYVAAGSSP